MSRFLRFSPILFSLAVMTTAATTYAESSKLPSLPATVSELDLSRYQGIWYEIAHFREMPRDYVGARHAFSRFFVEPGDDTRLRVVDEFDRLGGISHSKAWSQLFAPNTTRPGELVRSGRNMFGRPYTSPYHVYKLSEGYQSAVVGEPTGQHMYILSRTPYMEKNELTETILWLAGHTAYADILNRLHCTTQAYDMHDSCQNVLRRLNHL